MLYVCDKLIGLVSFIEVNSMYFKNKEKEIEIVLIKIYNYVKIFFVLVLSFLNKLLV